MSGLTGQAAAPHPAASANAAILIRESIDADVDAIQRIYAHHVLHGFGSFEEVPPTVEDIALRRGGFLALGMPYLVAEIDGMVAGYAYASPFRPRSAYRHSVEDSIYVAPEATRRGVGRALLDELVARCTALGFRQMIAVIGDSQNLGSIRLHEASGFYHAGVLKSVGRKLGRWVDSVMMQRALGPGDSTPPDPE